MLRIILCFLFILFPITGCSQKQENSVQNSESSYTELTLPQIPKLTESFKPTNKDIQTALQNAGFYKYKIDGDIGPLTEQAIREFQKENNLPVDGEIGPKTWSVLKKYLYQSEE
jgi:peptidoglycan hydrolase-like protein with peptidoglycan-binding domain